SRDRDAGFKCGGKPEPVGDAPLTVGNISRTARTACSPRRVVMMYDDVHYGEDAVERGWRLPFYSGIRHAALRTAAATFPERASSERSLSQDRASGRCAIRLSGLREGHVAAAIDADTARGAKDTQNDRIRGRTGEIYGDS